MQAKSFPEVVEQQQSATKDEFWISLFVLLSRCETAEQLLIVRLPPRQSFEGGPPQYLKTEFERLHLLEHRTLQELDAKLMSFGAHDAREYVTQPLLLNRNQQTGPLPQ